MYCQTAKTTVGWSNLLSLPLIGENLRCYSMQGKHDLISISVSGVKKSIYYVFIVNSVSIGLDFLGNRRRRGGLVTLKFSEGIFDSKSVFGFFMCRFAILQLFCSVHPLYRLSV